METSDQKETLKLQTFKLVTYRIQLVNYSKCWSERTEKIITDVAMYFNTEK